MKGDEDLRPDRGMDFETDDEENQAERVCEDDDDYESESDVTAPSRSASMHQNIDNPTWPQSYRYMYICSLCFFRKVSILGSSFCACIGLLEFFHARGPLLTKP